MIVPAIGAVACAGAGLMAYAVRGRSSSLLGPSVHRGPATSKTIALTFDDGPSESTPEILRILDEHKIPATFFECGANLRRLPEIGRQVVAAGHEIGNHSDTHVPFYLKSGAFIHNELSRAQNTIQETTGFTPSFLRAPYGVRWFGLREAQRRLHLKGVMWTVIGLDWKMEADDIAARVTRRVLSGGIICLHDGRGLERSPDVSSTVGAVRRLAPAILDRGFRFVTISSLLCPTT